MIYFGEDGFCGCNYAIIDWDSPADNERWENPRTLLDSGGAVFCLL